LEEERKTLEREVGALKKKNEHSKKIQQFFHISRAGLQRLTLSDYLVDRYIGNGCFGVVMLCRVPPQVFQVPNSPAGFEVALKMICNFQQLNTYSIAKQCANEYQILYRLDSDHPNIIQILHQFLGKPTPQMISFMDESVRDLASRRDGEVLTTQFFVLERHPHTLKQLCEQGNLSVSQKWQFTLEVARALKFLWKKRVVHFDMKLDNILVSQSFHAVVSDFGESRIVQPDYKLPGFSAVVGNPQHMAPEILNRLYENQNRARNDKVEIDCSGQWSWELGTIIFEIWSNGIFPFENYPQGLGQCRAPFIDNWRGLNSQSELKQIVSQLLVGLDERMGILEAYNQLKNALPQMAVQSPLGELIENLSNDLQHP